jgi:Lrp/AsnC family leucine-responsive transcriptional regulator
MRSFEFDAFDIRLLNSLQNNNQLTSQALSDKVHLSPSQCQRRQKKLEQDGVIQHNVAILDRQKAGFGVIAMVKVTLEKYGKKPADEFKQVVNAYPQILECWITTGDSDYILKVVSKDLNCFTSFIMDEILDLDIVANIRSTILLRQLKETTALPMDTITNK